MRGKSVRIGAIRHEVYYASACLFAAMQMLSGVCGVVASTTVHAQAVSQVPKQVSDEAAKMLDIEEQHRRTQQQTTERERRTNAPNVNLQGQSNAQGVDDGRVPAETPCFKIDEIALVTPQGLSNAVERIGARALSPDPVFPGQLSFASSYLQQYRGQCVGRDGLNLIVHRLSALILAKGYTTTRVLIGPQDLSGGKLTLELIPGAIGRIRFADAGTYGTWRNAFPTHDGDLLNLRNLEQGLEQMKRVPNQDVDMQIVPGDSTGESDVIITAKRLKPWTLSMSVDDSGLKSTGQLQASANLAINNPLGLSDIFNISYNHDVNGHPGQYGTRGDSVFYAIP